MAYGKEKIINEYILTIYTTNGYINWPTYQGFPIISVQTRKAQKNVLDELVQHGIDLDDVKEVLNLGYNCSRSKRRRGVLERCLDRGDKTIKVVVQRGFIELDGRECWELIHVGEFTRRR